MVRMGSWRKGRYGVSKGEGNMTADPKACGHHCGLVDGFCSDCQAQILCEKCEYETCRCGEENDPYEAVGESRFGLPGGGKSL